VDARIRRQGLEQERGKRFQDVHAAQVPKWDTVWADEKN
jgi:hypothetical protein